MTYRLFIILTFILFSHNSIAQKVDNIASIQGTILDEYKQSVTGAIIEISQYGIAKYGAATDEEGRYNIKAVPFGNYTIKFLYSGYYPDSSYVTIASQKYNKDVQLRPDTNALKSIEVGLFYSTGIDAVIAIHRNTAIPVPNATILLTKGRGKHAKVLETTTNNTRGMFSFGLENKNYTLGSLYLKVSAPSFKSKTVRAKKYAHKHMVQLLTLKPLVKEYHVSKTKEYHAYSLKASGPGVYPTCDTCKTISLGPCSIAADTSGLINPKKQSSLKRTWHKIIRWLDR